MHPGDYNILDLIPQRPPMQLIDKLLQADDRSARGLLHVTQDNLFFENGLLREPGLIEFMAQTAAAFTGYQKKLHNSGIREGYIGAIRNLVISDLPPVPCVLEAGIAVENEIVGFTLVSGKVFYENRCIASCELRILNG